MWYLSMLFLIQDHVNLGHIDILDGTVEYEWGLRKRMAGGDGRGDNVSGQWAGVD